MTDSIINNYVIQVPGELNIEMVDDNDLVFSIDWGIDLTGYIFNAYIIPNDGSDEIAISVVVYSYSLGQMNVIIPETALVSLLPGVHSWYMNWTTPAPDNYIQTILAGVLALRPK
jgi:hypothetical protein